MNASGIDSQKEQRSTTVNVSDCVEEILVVNHKRPVFTKAMQPVYLTNVTVKRTRHVGTLVGDICIDGMYGYKFLGCCVLDRCQNIIENSFSIFFLSKDTISTIQLVNRSNVDEWQTNVNCGWSYIVLLNGDIKFTLKGQFQPEIQKLATISVIAPVLPINPDYVIPLRRNQPHTLIAANNQQYNFAVIPDGIDASTADLNLMTLRQYNAIFNDYAIIMVENQWIRLNVNVPNYPPKTAIQIHFV